MEFPSSTIKVKLPNEAEVNVEVTRIGGESDVSSKLKFYSLGDIEAAIEGIAGVALEAIKKVKPTKAAVEFGIEVGVEAGQLTALLVKGTGKANLKISLEWSEAHGTSSDRRTS